jgi:hypothetical protein
MVVMHTNISIFVIPIESLLADNLWKNLLIDANLDLVDPSKKIMYRCNVEKWDDTNVPTFAWLIDICVSGGHTNFKSDSLFSFWPSNVLCIACALVK